MKTMKPTRMGCGANSHLRHEVGQVFASDQHQVFAGLLPGLQARCSAGDAGSGGVRAAAACDVHLRVFVNAMM
jgi:hypothetical protein